MQNQPAAAIPLVDDFLNKNKKKWSVCCVAQVAQAGVKICPQGLFAPQNIVMSMAIPSNVNNRMTT